MEKGPPRPPSVPSQLGRVGRGVGPPLPTLPPLTVKHKPDYDSKPWKDVHEKLQGRP